ncbi:hypothetical protein [Acinetobacter baumannii]|uniref:hypothetical protein n=1 Tax=Acinetobacter baumannii TaxID=470 RepID=UPI0022B405EC|nr:hypothetical protein [Acinetobacter baumannii]
MYIIPQPKNYPDFYKDTHESLLHAYHITELGKNILYENFHDEEIKDVFNNKLISRNLRYLSSATKKISKKSLRFPDLKATCNIAYDKSSREESMFVDYLLSQIMWTLSEHMSRFTEENNCKVMLGLEWQEKVWRNVKGESFNPLCIDDLEIMLSHSKPSTLIFLDYCIKEDDPLSGFVLYLFDKSDKLIFKTIYKFFDLADAPDNSFRLNLTKSPDDFADTSRSFLSCNFTTP